MLKRMYTGQHGLYVYRQVLNNGELEQFGVRSGLRDSFTQTEMDELHCTVIYSGDSLPVHAQPDQGTVEATAVGIDVWEGHDGSGYLVLLLSSDHLQTGHQRWRDLGWQPKTYYEYNPHVTLQTPYSAYNRAAVQRASAMLSDVPLLVYLGQEYMVDSSQA